jgi:hypothetical protein
LLEQCFIDHRVASPQRPQSDGLAERCVSTVKSALRKKMQDLKVTDEWDEELPWVMLGYNCSAQASTKFSPYQIMHGQLPTLPARLRPRLEQVIDFDDPRVAERELLERGKLVQELCIMAGQNLAIAQHRDTLRYAQVRSGAYKPRLTKFAAGDFVYLRRPTSTALHMRVRPTIYKIYQVRASGRVVLQGKCGSFLKSHLSHLTPCHLANIDSTVDVTLQRPDADKACEACRNIDDEQDMLLCDNCGDGWHTFCLTPPLTGPCTLWHLAVPCLPGDRRRHQYCGGAYRSSTTSAEEWRTTRGADSYCTPEESAAASRQYGRSCSAAGGPLHHQDLQGPRHWPSRCLQGAP